MPKPTAISKPRHDPSAPHAAMRALSERTDGPALIAVWGEDAAGSDFPLGTRETDWHSHARGQLFCIASGLVHVRPTTARGCCPRSAPAGCHPASRTRPASVV
jgi:hypothetical protein